MTDRNARPSNDELMDKADEIHRLDASDESSGADLGLSPKDKQTLRHNARRGISHFILTPFVPLIAVLSTHFVCSVTGMSIDEKHQWSLVALVISFFVQIIINIIVAYYAGELLFFHEEKRIRGKIESLFVKRGLRRG